jgi:hypothetical protein
MASHLIKFRSKLDYQNAIMTLLEVPQGRLGLPDLQMVVTDAHIAALHQAGVPFDDRTKATKRRPRGSICAMTAPEAS